MTRMGWKLADTNLIELPGVVLIFNDWSIRYSLSLNTTSYCLY